MSNRLLHFNVALAAAVLGLAPVAYAVELDKSAVTYMTPDQFKWTTNAAGVEQALLVGDPTKAGSLYVYINRFKPDRFGVAHTHPNDRYITVIEGAGWRGTGLVVDPAHTTRLPKGSFAIDHANMAHWDGTKACHQRARREDRRRLEWRRSERTNHADARSDPVEGQRQQQDRHPRRRSDQGRRHVRTDADVEEG
jgi:hypothetical protein